jgi:multidrug efflux pump subunit AcrB
MEKEKLPGGPISWMAQNSVASNLLMAVLIIGGLLMLMRIKKEVFPEFALDMVRISVAYPGASPEEVEQGIILPIEEAVRGLDSVKEVQSQALENLGAVVVQLIEGTDANKALSDIKAAVDRLTNLPLDAERPITSLVVAKNLALSLVIYGNSTHDILRKIADDVRDDLTKDKRITLVEMPGVPPREIAIELSQNTLRDHQLTIGQVANIVKRASVDLPGGGLKTANGETLVRTKERKEFGAEFKDITVKDSFSGANISLGDIAIIRDDFQDLDYSSTYNGQNSVRLDIYMVGKQGPLEVAQAAKEYIEKQKSQLPPGIRLAIWDDRSQMFGERADLLKSNAIQGLILVFICLGLFLDLRLAFWVMMGIPTSILGSFLLLPNLDISINMISMFAFIVTLGIVVDDAIVVGENVYDKQAQGLKPMQASIQGIREVAGPVTFAVLTTVAAFAPLLFVPGASGKFMRQIPVVVICVLLISLVESIFVLPAHLAHLKMIASQKKQTIFTRFQDFMSGILNWFIETIYAPILRFCTEYRYFALALATAGLILSFSMLAGGVLKFTFMPKLEGDIVMAKARLPIGSPLSETENIKEKLLDSLDDILKRYGGDQISLGVYAQTGASLPGMGGRPGANPTSTGGHIVDVAVRLVSMDKRPVGAEQIASEWREANRGLIGLKSITFSSDTGGPGGIPVDISLSHKDPKILQESATLLAQELKAYQGVKDVNDGFDGGKRQIDLKLKDSATRLGLSESDVARQIRDSFFGAEALRIQRGRDEVRVIVRLPKNDRESLIAFEGLLLKTPQNGEIPLLEAVNLEWGQAFNEIQRDKGKRIVHVTADVDAKKGNANEILAQVKKDVLPRLEMDIPGLSYSFDGQQKDQAETMSSLGVGFLMALFAIFALLAIPFKSYLQPMIIMISIPFGLIGAIGGHLLLGYDLSFISMMGVVALSGVVVNDALVLIDAVNQFRALGSTPMEAVLLAGQRRFRPILLTSLTTFAGLMPITLESSVQARFLIPMAISLGCGVAFATLINLLLVPAVYLITEDLKALFGFGNGVHNNDLEKTEFVEL